MFLSRKNRNFKIEARKVNKEVQYQFKQIKYINYNAKLEEPKTEGKIRMSKKNDKNYEDHQKPYSDLLIAINNILHWNLINLFPRKPIITADGDVSIFFLKK